MTPVRRSQRLSTQPHGHQNGHADGSERKRKMSGGEAPENTKKKRYRLTEKNLRQHRMQEDSMAKTRKTPSGSSQAKSVTTNTTDQQFGPRLNENGVMYGGPKVLAPKDYDIVKTALEETRELPASTLEDWQDLWCAWEEMALNELSLESEIIKLMLNLYKPPHRKYRQFRNDQWTEVDNEISAGISDPKPDVTESYLLSVYPKGFREDFEELVPTQRGYAMPTFAMESKGQGDPSQAEKQAAYDGAIMTHAALAAETQMGKDEKELYSTTKAITVTLNPMEICVYANHAVKGEPNNRIIYHHHCIERVRYFDSEDNWKRACTVVYNAQAFAFNLAHSRVRDLEEYYQKEIVRLQNLKAEQEKLQAEARAKAKAVTPAPMPRKRQSKAKAMQQALPDAVDVTTVPTVDQASQAA